MALYDINEIKKLSEQNSTISTTPPSGVSFMGTTAPETPVPNPEETESPLSEAIGSVGNPLSIVPGIYKGIKYGIPGIIADSAQLLGVESAKGISDWAKEGLNTGEKKTWTEQAGEMIPMSGGVQIAATVIGNTLLRVPAIGPWGLAAKAAGAALIKAAPHITPVLFGLSAGQGTKELIEEQQAKGIEIKDPELATAEVVGINWLGETIGNKMLQKALGPLAPAVKISKEIISKMAVPQLLRGSVGDFIKRFSLQVLPTEIATEMGQNYAQAVVEKDASIRPEAQPGMEAISAIGPTTVMTGVMSAFGLAAHRHISNKQAEFMARPVSPDLMKEDSDAAEKWKDIRFKVAENVSTQINDEGLKSAWIKYSTDMITNNKSIRIDKTIEELVNAKPITSIVPTDVTKELVPVEQKSLSPEEQRAQDLEFLMGVGKKLTGKKKQKLNTEEINTLMNQEGKSDSFKRVADHYLKALGYTVTDPIRKASGVDEFKPSAEDTPVAELGGFSKRGKETLDKMLNELPTKAETNLESVISGRPEGGDFTRHNNLAEVRKKLISATRGTKEDTKPLVTIPVSDLSNYETAAEMINNHPINTGRVDKKGQPVVDTVSNQIIINKKTKEQFEIIDYDIKEVSQGKGKKKKEMVTGFLVRPKLILPETIGKSVKVKRVNISEVQQLIEDSHRRISSGTKITETIPKNEITVANMITETSPGSGEFTYPKTHDELISVIAQKKAAGVDVSKLLGEIRKTEGKRTPATYITSVLKAIKKAADKRANEVKIKKAAADFSDVDNRPKKIYPSKDKPLTDIQKAINEGAGYTLGESEEGLSVLMQKRPDGSEVPTVHATMTDAENRAKELNEKFGLRVGEKFQKNKPMVYFADTIKVDSKDKKGNAVQVDQYVVKKRTQVWVNKEIAKGKKSILLDPLLHKAMQLFDDKLADSELNSVQFIHDVLLPFIKARLGESGASTAGTSKKIVLPPKFNLQPSDEVDEYLAGTFTRIPLAGQKLLAYGRLWNRLNEAMDRNYDIVGEGTKFIRGKDGKLKTVKSETKDVLKPVDQLTMIDPSGIPYLKRSEMEVLLDELTKTETGWKALEKFDKTHAAPDTKKVRQSMIGLEVRKAKDAEIARTREEADALKKEIEQVRLDKIKRDAAKKFGTTVQTSTTVSNKAKQAKLKQEKKAEDVLTDREISLNLKNKTLKKLITKVLESKTFAIKETENPTTLNPSILDKVSRMLTKYGKDTIETWHDEAQVALENAESDRAINILMMERDFFSVNTEPSLMTEIDIVKLAAMHDYMVSKNRDLVAEMAVELGKSVNKAQELNYQNMDLLGISEDPDSRPTGISETTRKKQQNQLKDPSEMTLEELVGTSEQIPAKMAMASKKAGKLTPEERALLDKELIIRNRKIKAEEQKLKKQVAAQKRKALSEAQEEKLVNNAEQIIDLEEKDAQEGFRSRAQSFNQEVSDILPEEMDDIGIYSSNPQDMSTRTMGYISEYVADTRSSSTFTEFKLSLHEFMGKVWDKVKHLAKYLWDRIQYKRGFGAINSIPQDMRVGGDGRRQIDYKGSRDIESLWTLHIKPDIKQKAQLARARAEQTQDPRDFQTADHYFAATQLNILSNAKNKDYYNKIFDYVINKEWNIPKRTFSKLKSYLTQQKIANLDEVRKNIPWATKFLALGKDNKYTVQSIRTMKAEISKHLSPWMFNKPGEVAYRGAITKMNMLLDYITGDTRDGIQISEKWAVINDNDRTQYIARQLTPAYKSQINDKISNDIGVKFDLDVAVTNPGAFNKGVSVRLYNHPINPNSVIPTVDIQTNSGLQYVLRKIDGKWHSVFFSAEDLLNMETVEDMKKVEAVEANIVASNPQNMSLGYIGFNRLIKSLPRNEQKLAIINHNAATEYAKVHNIRSMKQDFGKNEVMRQLYGWHRNLDGDWRYEITDSRLKWKTGLEVRVLGAEYLLSDRADVKYITNLYDKAKTTKLIFANLGKLNGKYDPSTNTIYLNFKLRPQQALTTLSHELQHLVQSIESKPAFKTDSTMIAKFGNRLIEAYNAEVKWEGASEEYKAIINSKRNIVKRLMATPDAKINQKLLDQITLDLYRLESREIESRITADRRALGTKQLRETPIFPDTYHKNSIVESDRYDATPVSLSFLKMMIPTAAITQIDETGERFDIIFPGGFGFRVENMTITEVNNEGVSGQWRIDDGVGLLRIAGLDSPNINMYSNGEEVTTAQIALHELVHMISNVFMTKQEQAMLLSAFRIKGESDLQTWEHISNHLITSNSKNLSNIQKTFIEKVRYNAKLFLYNLKDLIFGKQVESYKSPEALFDAIKSGEITKRPALLNMVSPKAKGYISNLRSGSLPIIVTNKKYRKLIDPNLAAKERLIASQASQNFKWLAKLSTNSTIDGEIPFNRTSMETMTDWLTDEKAALNNKLGPLMKWYEHLLSNPLFKAGATMLDKDESSPTYGQRITKYPAWAGAVQIERDRFHANTNLGADFVQKTETFHRLKNASIVKLDPLLEAGTTVYKRYFTRPELENPEFIAKVHESVKAKGISTNLSEDEIAGYLEVTDYMENVMRPALIKHAEESMIKPYESALDPKEYAELLRLYNSLLAGHTPQKSNLERTFNRKEFMHYDPVTKRTTNRLKSAYNNLSKKLIDIRRERATIGFQGGYMPLRREPSSNYVSVKLINEDGSKETVKNYSAFSDSHAARIANALVKNLPELKDNTKYEVRIGRSSRPLDSTFFMVGDMNTTRIIDLAISRLTENQTLDLKDATTLSNSLYDAVADIMKARGAGSHAIHRKIANIDGKIGSIEGYIKQDFRKIIDGYVYGYIGMQTKFKAATEYMKLLNDVKSGNPSMYAQVSEYAKNNLRNMDEWDKRIGKIKGFMFHFYLAGKISIMFLQLTQNFITGIPLMATKMHSMGIKTGVAPEKIMMSAMRDVYAPHRLSAAEKALLDYFKKRGDTMAQYLKSVKIETLTSGNKMAIRMLDILAWPMKKSEEYNREAAILAYHRMLTQKAGYNEITDKEKIYKEAEEFMYNSHWWYSRSNLPTVAHGADVFSRLGNLAYTFRPFTHHYVLSLAYNFLNHGGTGGLIYAARSFAWLAILGGVPAIPWIDDFIELVEGWTGIPIRMKTRNSMEKLAGEMGAKFSGAGIFGLMNMDMSAAMRPAGIPFVGGDASQSAFGVYSGAWKKFSKAYEEANLGEFTRAFESASPVAAENIFKAYRLYEKGMTTSGKNPIYDKNGEIKKIKPVQAILQSWGFKNYDYSTIMQDEWEKKVVLDHYNKEKSKIIKQQHLANTPGEMEKVLMKMINFNMSIPPYLIGVVTPVKWNRVAKPDKKMGRLRYAMEME